MTQTTNNSSAQPSIDSLMVRFLATHSDAAAAAVEQGESEVEPHEVAAGFRVDPRAAWLDATAAHTTGGNAPPPAIQPISELAVLVGQSSAVFAVPMAPGHFPQCVNDLQPLLTQFNPSEMRPGPAAKPLPGYPGLRSWIAKHGNESPSIAAGVARMLGDNETAEELLRTQPITANEAAAMLWANGKCTQAQELWNQADDSPAILFNRGMAALFLNNPAAAREWFQKAIEVIPGMSGWNALARLYLAVAELQGS